MSEDQNECFLGFEGELGLGFSAAAFFFSQSVRVNGITVMCLYCTEGLNHLGVTIALLQIPGPLVIKSSHSKRKIIYPILF